jgi:hypothetical protein
MVMFDIKEAGCDNHCILTKVLLRTPKEQKAEQMKTSVKKGLKQR